MGGGGEHWIVPGGGWGGKHWIVPGGGGGKQ